MTRRAFLPPILIVLLLISLPYLLAYFTAGPNHVFAGFLHNPLDGATYLAKMEEGYQGAWRFTLPFTAEPGQGAYLFLFYLALGHLARLTGLPLALTFHIARILGAGLLLWALVRWYARIFPSCPDLFRLAYWLTVIGAGMGYLVIFAGLNPPPSDFWVAEAYPFLSMFGNPHFPIGLALLLFALELIVVTAARWRAPLLLLAGLLLAVIFPFAEVVALLVAIVWTVWGLIRPPLLKETYVEKKGVMRCLLPLIALGALGGPFLLYQFWAAATDPVLSGWNAQNVTPSPPLWDFLLTFSPALPFALFGVYRLIVKPRRAEARDDVPGGGGSIADSDIPEPWKRLLLAWFIPGLLLIYFPFALQRRFMLGFYIPTAALAVIGLDAARCALAARVPGLARRLGGLLVGLSLPTNAFLLLLLISGIFSHAPELYLTRNEAAALDWIRAQAPPRALVLASPDMGRFIPGFTGQRVIYGHPFETVNAQEEKASVEAFYAGKSGPAFLLRRGVYYVIFGPRERKLNPGLHLPVDVQLGIPGPQPAFQSGDVSVYWVARK